jgi:hypothetical protein
MNGVMKLHIDDIAYVYLNMNTFVCNRLIIHFMILNP